MVRCCSCLHKKDRFDYKPMRCGHRCVAVHVIQMRCGAYGPDAMPCIWSDAVSSLYKNNYTPMRSGAYGPDFARNSHAGFGKPFYEPNILISIVFGRKVLTKSGVAISRKCCFPHGLAYTQPVNETDAMEIRRSGIGRIVAPS